MMKFNDIFELFYVAEDTMLVFVAQCNSIPVLIRSEMYGDFLKNSNLITF